MVKICGFPWWHATFFGSEWLPVIFLLQFKRSYLTPVKKIQLFQLFQFGIFHFICKNRIYSIPILSNLKLNAISWRSEDSKKSLRNPEIKNKRKMKSHDEKLMNIRDQSTAITVLINCETTITNQARIAAWL